MKAAFKWGQHICLCFVFCAFPLFLFDGSKRAFACACCSEPGMRIESEEDMNQDEKSELARLRFDDTSQLFTSPAFPDDVEGIVNPSDQPFRLRVVTESEQWRFELSDSEGGHGAIAFALPRRLVRFEVDPRDENGTSVEGGPRLYKEWRLESTAELSGMVAQGNNKAPSMLILQGHGNACTSAEDFTYWTLLIDGPGVKFTLLGKLKAK
jgi:hypothetical protein